MSGSTYFIRRVNDASERMQVIYNLFSKVHQTIGLEQQLSIMKSSEWSIEGVEAAVRSFDQLMRQRDWENVGDSRDAATRLVRGHLGHVISCCALLETLMSHLESMTQSCSTGRGSAALQDVLRKSIDMLRVVCLSLVSWYLPFFHLGDCALLHRVVNQVLRWALGYTRQQGLAPLPETTKSAIARSGLLCMRTFQGLPPHMLLASICKLPPTLAPMLACFLCENFPSRIAQVDLLAETQDEMSLSETLVDYLGPGGLHVDCRAMSKVVLSPSVLEWSRMEFVGLIQLPSLSAVVRKKERSDGKNWPPCTSEAKEAWNHTVTLYGHFQQAFCDGGYSSGGGGALDAFLYNRCTIDPAAYLRALRIVARNVPVGMVRSEVRGRDSLLLKQQIDCLQEWQAHRKKRSTGSQRDRDMAFGMAAFSANTALHWLKYGHSSESGISGVVQHAQTVMADLWTLVWGELPDDCMSMDSTGMRLNRWARTRGAAVTLEALLRGAGSPQNPAPSMHDLCHMTAGSADGILAMINLPAAASICYCLALTVSKLLNKHNLTSGVQAAYRHASAASTQHGSSSSNGSSSGISSSSSSSNSPPHSPCDLQELHQSLTSVFSTLRNHMVMTGTNDQERQEPPTHTNSRIQAIKISTLWLLYRSCNQLYAWLHSSHTSADFDKLSPGSSKHFTALSPAARKTLRQKQLATLVQIRTQQGGQFTAMTQFPTGTVVQPPVLSSNSEVASGDSLPTQAQQLLSWMDARWHCHSMGVLQYGVMPGCGNAQCRNTSGFSEGALPTKLCRGCRRVRYCSAACQRAAWIEGGHKLVCKV